MTAIEPTFTCAIDQSPHESLEALHKHLRSKLKVTQEVYYNIHVPRLDRFTGEPIPFKAPAAEYLKREFKDKHTLKRWLKERPEEGRDWALDWLAKRVVEKGLTHAPCHVELRSLACPSTDYYEENFEGGWAGVCEWAGLQTRFGGQLPEPSALPCPVVIDTREQKPLKLPVESVGGTLRSADYGLPAEHDQLVYIERKSMLDLIGTLSARETREGDSNLARFTRELERVTEIGAYVVMLVEQSLSDCLAYDTIPHLKRVTSHVKVGPEHVFYNLRALFHQFPYSFQALFVDGRTEAARAVVRVLASGEAVKRCDLQLIYDRKELVLA